MLADAWSWQQVGQRLKLQLALVWRHCLQLSWRQLVALGAALYLLCPLWPTPWWQLQLLGQDQQTASSELQLLTAFYQQHGDAMLPALVAQLQLDKLTALAAAYQADNAEFSAQSRDPHWAEATEFLIQHLAANQSNSALPLKEVECRNTLCQVQILTSTGLTPALQQRIVKLAASLKTADLEFKDLTQRRTELVLLFQSSKALKLGFFAERRLNPAQKAVWLAEIKQWLYPQMPKTAPTEGAKP